MKQILEPLRTSVLTNMEAGQLLKRHANDLNTIDPALLTDPPFNSYIQELNVFADAYEKAFAQIRKNEETEKISLADAERDKAVSAFSLALKLYALSDEPEEVEASRGLRIVFSNFKNLAALNYEAESMAVDKLVSELETPEHAVKINKLKIGRYVNRLKTTNEAFKTIFSGRMVTTAMTEVFDVKTLRIEMLKKYSEFCNYVLAMAKALNTPLFLNTLNLLNTARKYYSDMLARRTAKKEEQAEPVD